MNAGAGVVAGEVIAEERRDQQAEGVVDDDRAGPAAEAGHRAGALGGQAEPHTGGWASGSRLPGPCSHEPTSRRSTMPARLPAPLDRHAYGTASDE